jgi:hypothetical protein
LSTDFTKTQPEEQWRISESNRRAQNTVKSFVLLCFGPIA